MKYAITPNDNLEIATDSAADIQLRGGELRGDLAYGREGSIQESR